VAKAKTTSKTKTPAPVKSAAADKLWAQYVEKPDRELLRVYADALAQAGDPRGTFINLCLLDNPSAEQQAAKQTMAGKQKKVLAGPGGEFLREFDFGPDGLVMRARTEADKVIDNVAALATLSPHLVLTVTSIKTQKDAQAFAKADLGPIYFVDFGWITGTHGGMKLDDKQLEAVAPALANVRHLQLSCVGTKAFSPAALRAIGPKLKALRYLAIQFHPDGRPPVEEYTKAIAETFPPTLRAFEMDGVAKFHGRDLRITNFMDYGRTDIGARDFVTQLEAATA
jgi:hypothetical protein